MNPLSKKTLLAQAKRHLKRIEEDEARLRLRIAGLDQDEQEKALQWYQGIVEKQREYVRELEQGFPAAESPD